MSDIQLSGLQSRTDIRTSTGTSEFFHKKKLPRWSNFLERKGETQQLHLFF